MPTFAISMHILPIPLQLILRSISLLKLLISIIPINVDKGEQYKQGLIQHILEIVISGVVVKHIIEDLLNQFNGVRLPGVHVAGDQGCRVGGQLGDLVLLLLYACC